MGWEKQQKQQQPTYCHYIVNCLGLWFTAEWMEMGLNALQWDGVIFNRVSYHFDLILKGWVIEES